MTNRHIIARLRPGRLIALLVVILGSMLAGAQLQWATSQDDEVPAPRCSTYDDGLTRV